MNKVIILYDKRLYINDKYQQYKIFVRSVVYLGYLSAILRVPQYNT